MRVRSSFNGLLLIVLCVAFLTICVQGIRERNRISSLSALSSSSSSSYIRKLAADTDKSVHEDVNEKNIVDFDLDTAMQRAQENANLIYQRFEYWHPTRRLFFLYIANIPEWGWDILKYKLALKTLLPSSDRSADVGSAEGSNCNSRPSTATSSRSSNERKEFLYVFGGSSVTAGHDNWFNESYPLVFRRRMQGMYDALNVPLTVRNIAQGASNCFPSNFCYTAMGGNTPDWLNWEQSYNCGKAHGVYEQVAREAAWTDAVLHFAASGAFVPECIAMPFENPVPVKEDERELPPPPLRRKMAWTNEQWTPEKAGLKEGEPLPHDYKNMTGYDEFAQKHVYHAYVPNATDVQNLKELLHSGHMEANPVGRFTGMMWPHYNGVALHGFSVWTKGSEGDAMGFKGPCYEQGGAHWMCKETATFTRGHGANWHPPAGMHLLRGEVLAYNYLHIFMDAVLMLKADIIQLGGGEKGAAEPGAVFDSKMRDTLVEKYRAKLKSLQHPIPVKPLRCGPDCDRRPECFTNYEPHYNAKQKLSELVVGSHPGWLYLEKSGSTNHIEGGKDWGYLDRRPCYESQGIPDATISFKVNIRSKEANFLKICSYNQKEGLKHAHFFLHVNVDTPGPVPPCSECIEALDVRHGEKWNKGTAGAVGDEWPTPDLPPLNLYALPSLAPTTAPPPLMRHRHRQTRRDLEGAEEEVSTLPTSGTAAAAAAYILPPLDTLLHIKLDQRKYHGDECHGLLDLPVGTHILTVSTHFGNDTKNAANMARKVYSVTHVIEWE